MTTLLTSMHVEISFQFLYHVPFFKYVPTFPVISSAPYIWPSKQNFFESQPSASPNHPKATNKTVGIPALHDKFFRDLSQIGMRVPGFRNRLNLPRRSLLKEK